VGLFGNNKVPFTEPSAVAPDASVNVTLDTHGCTMAAANKWPSIVEIDVVPEYRSII
jgi:hypothetical protein